MTHYKKAKRKNAVFLTAFLLAKKTIKNKNITCQYP